MYLGSYKKKKHFRRSKIDLFVPKTPFFHVFFTRQQQKTPKRSCFKETTYRLALSFLQDFCFAQFGYFQAEKAQLYKVQKETPKDNLPINDLKWPQKDEGDMAEAAISPPECEIEVRGLFQEEKALYKV